MVYTKRHLNTPQDQDFVTIQRNVELYFRIKLLNFFYKLDKKLGGLQLVVKAKALIRILEIMFSRFIENLTKSPGFPCYIKSRIISLYFI